MACLDTSFLVDLLRGKPEVSKLKDSLDQNEALVCIAAPSVMELWTGALLSAQPEKEKEKIKQLLESLTILSLTQRSALKAAEIEAELVKTGKIIETEDMMIAGIALAHGETVVTKDSHYARIAGLRVLKY